MKLGKIFSAVMVATPLGATAVVATPQADLTAQAKAKKSLKTIPKKFRGTWYHYEKGYGYDYNKISATKRITRLTFYGMTNTRKVKMHQFDLNKGNKAGKNPHMWMYAYKHGTKYIMAEWGTEASDRETYTITTRKYQGKNVKVIKVTYPIFNSWEIYSPSKALAKHLWNLDNK